MIKSLAFIILRFLILAISVISVSSCASRDGSTFSVINTGEAAEKKSVTSEPVTAPAGESNSFQTADKIEDPFDSIEGFWQKGDIQSAKAVFWSEDVKELRNSLRTDEWSMWRGRLYIQSWAGADFGLAGENISAILTDHDDIWLGTWTGGLSRFSLPLNEKITWDAGLPSKAVRTVNRIIKHRESVISIRYGSVETYNGRTSKWDQNWNLPVNERLQDYLITGDKSYLASLGQGLWVRDGNHWSQLLQPGLFINRLEIAGTDEILVGTMDRGLYMYNTRLDKWSRPDNMNLRYANVTSVGTVGNLIVGGTYGDGAFYWDRQSGETGFFTEDILGDAWVLSVAVRDEWVYFATFGAGLNAWNTINNSWDRLGIEEGLPNGDIASLAIAEDGSLWAGTLGGGIVRIEKGIHGE